MKLIYCLLIPLLFLNCSKEEEQQPPQDYEQFISAEILSYSKNYGHSGEEITMYGKHFTTDLSKITLKFDDVPATIVSATLTEIKFILPVTTNLVPELNLAITSKVTNKFVTNEYNGNIGILPAINYNSWIVCNSNPTAFYEDISAIQHIDNKKIYLAMGGGNSMPGVFRTLDGGITWKKWASNWYYFRANEGFHATANDAGLSSYSGAIKIPVGGSDYLNTLTLPTSDFVGASYIDDDLKYTTVALQNGKIYSSSNGVDFSLAHESSFWASGTGIKCQITCSEKPNFDNMWLGGLKFLSQNNIANHYPILIYKTNTSAGWQEYSFPIETGIWQNFRQLQMLGTVNGYALIHEHTSGITAPTGCKIYKTTNGGSTWAKVYDGTFFKNMTFKDLNTGWAIEGNKIYKTIDGGVSWQVDYTHTQDLKNISYKDGQVWSFSGNFILKYYIQ